MATGRATARFLGTSSPNTIDTEVAINSASDQRHAHREVFGQPERAEHRPQQTRDQRFGQVPGDQRGDRDTHLGAGELKRQRAVRPLHVTGRAARRVRALASTVLRSSAVSENSAATNSAVPAVSATKATSSSSVRTTLIVFSWGDRRAACPAD